MAVQVFFAGAERGGDGMPISFRFSFRVAPPWQDSCSTRERFATVFLFGSTFPASGYC